MKQFHIYTLTDPRDGIVRYVGCTINPQLRLRQHITESLSLLNRKKIVFIKLKADWIKELHLLSLTPNINIVSICCDEESASTEEIKLYDKYSASGQIFCQNPRRKPYLCNGYTNADGVNKIAREKHLPFLKSFIKERRVKISDFNKLIFPYDAYKRSQIKSKFSGPTRWWYRDTLAIKDKFIECFPDDADLIKSMLSV